MEKINLSKSWPFRKINETGKSLVRLRKKKERWLKIIIWETKEGTSLETLWTIKR